METATLYMAYLEATRCSTRRLSIFVPFTSVSKRGTIALTVPEFPVLILQLPPAQDRHTGRRPAF